MKILQILPELNVGGVETGTIDFAKYLKSHGHEPFVVSNGGVLVEELNKQNILHFKLPVHKKSFWMMLYSCFKLIRLIRQHDIQIVHARSRIPAWIAYFACRRTNAFFITTCHGHYSQHLFSRVMGWSKYVIVPSEVIGRHMIDHFGVPPESIRLIPRSVDLERFKQQRQEKPGQSQFIVTIVGRITPLKGHEYFFKAIAKVVRQMPYIKVWVIGDAPAKKQPYKDHLINLIRRLGIGDYVEFKGNRKDVPELLAQSDVVVLSTVTQEAFGRVILEAQAAGVPVVATSVGGVVDVVKDEETGLLVMPRDVEAMAQATMRLIQDRPLVKKITMQARKKLETEYTLDLMCGRTIGVYEELLHSLNILVIKISAMGDVILITASLKALRDRFPQAKIHCLVGKDCAHILQGCPYIDGVIVYDHKGDDKGWNGLWQMGAKLRGYKFDKVIDLQNNRKSHILAALSWASHTYGYDNGKLSFLLTHRIKDKNPQIGPVSHQFQILNMLGIREGAGNYIRLWPSKQDEEFIDRLFSEEWLSNAKEIIGINIAASSKWQTKNWPIEYIAELCDILAKDNVRVVVTGIEKDLAAARQLLTLAKTKPTVLIGKTNILQLAALIKRCRAFLTSDSAPMHIAAAVGTPFVALFGPTDPVRHLPPAIRYELIRRDLTCSPCYSSHCKILTHVCMRDIKPIEVAEKIKKLMA